MGHCRQNELTWCLILATLTTCTKWLFRREQKGFWNGFLDGDDLLETCIGLRTGLSKLTQKFCWPSPPAQRSCTILNGRNIDLSSKNLFIFANRVCNANGLFYIVSLALSLSWPMNVVVSHATCGWKMDTFIARSFSAFGVFRPDICVCV